MKKRISSMLLAIVMVACLLPTMTLAASAEQMNPTEHIHDNLFTYSHYYTAITSATTRITEESFFYLTDDVALDGTLTVSSGWSYLCLNGHTLSLKSGVTGSVIKVESGAVLSICNCSSEKGVITGGNAVNGGGICNEGVVRIERNNTGKIVVTGNTASSLGGGIYNGNSMHVASPFEVTGNTAEVNGGGLYFHYIPAANFYNCQITGDTWIINNSVNGQANNVCLEKGAYFSCDDNSDVTARIGITPAEALTALEPLDVLTDSSECPQGACAWEGVFFADDPTLYSIKLEPYNSGGTEGRYKLYLERTPGVGDVLYPIQFDANASGIPDPVSAPYLAGSTLPLKDTKISKPGAIFLGWKCSADDKVYTGSYTIPADFNDPNGITFTALWGYDVSYHVNRGLDSAKYAMTEKSAYQAGETVVVSPREGYVLNTVYYKNSSEGTFSRTATPQSNGTHTFTMPANDVVIWAYDFSSVPTGTHTHDCNHTYCDGTWENATFLSDSSQLRPSVTSGSTSYFMLRRNFDPGFDPSTFEPTLSSGTATIYLCLNGYKINTVTVPSGVTMYICNCAAANGSVPNLNNNGTVYVGAGTYRTIGPDTGEIHVYDEITLTDYKYTSSRIFRMMSADARIHFSGKPDNVKPIQVYPYAEGVFATGWDDSYGRLSNIVKSGDSQYTVESDGGNLIARKKPTFAVTYADPNGVTANGKYQVDKTEAVFEELVYITITPDSGYEVDSVTVVRTLNSSKVPVSGTGNTRSFYMPGVDATVKVTFKPGPILVTGVSLNKESTTLTVGDTETLTATVTPDNADNKAVTWTSGNTSVATVDSSGKVTAKAAGTTTITVTAADGSGVSAACTVTVNAVTYTITAGATEGGTVTGGGTYTAGASVTLAATPETGYSFVNWTENDTVVSTDATYTFTAAANRMLVANFEKLGYTVKFVNVDGSVLQSSEVAYGETPVYSGETPAKQATAQYSYTFTGWDQELTAVTGEVTYTAVYTSTVNEYTVTFVNENGDELQSSEVAYGEIPVYSGETPAKQATAQYSYTFTGWDQELAAVTGEITYTAVYSSSAKQYTVKFVNDDGDELQSSEVAYGEIPVYSGETPAKQATAQYSYTFTGWDQELTAVTGEVTYTAVYNSSAKQYTVKFVNEDGDELQSSEVAYGETPVYSGETPAKQATAQYSYTFTGWDQELAAVTGEITYTAVYTSTVNKYTVTFVNEDDTLLQSSEVAYGETPVYIGETPTKQATAQYSYTFTGWDQELAAVTGEITYTAVYTSTANKYTVTFVNEDGTLLQSGEVAYGEIPVYSGEAPTKQASAQYSYTFTGWDQELTAVTGEVTYTAVYSSSAKQYTVKFVNEDGSVLQSSEVAYGEIPVYSGETPAKQASAQYSYTFTGWDQELAAVTGEITYTAVYTNTVNKYTVTFVNEDGSVLQSSEVAYGEIPVYSGEPPAKQATAQYSYTFTGWDQELAAVTGEITYTAVYTSTANKYTVTFVNEDGTLLQSGKVAYGETPVYSGETPVKQATAQYSYTFTGWDQELAAVTGEVTYTAVYTSTVNKYTVTFYDEDGTTVLECKDWEYGQNPVYNNGQNPTKQATAEKTFVFSGWTPAVVPVDGPASYQATFTDAAVSYTVTWYDEDGTTVLASTVWPCGSTPNFTGETPVKESDGEYTYAFKEWHTVSGCDESGKIIGDAAYKAVYTAEKIAYSGVVSSEDGSLENVTADGLAEAAEAVNKHIVLHVKAEPADPNNSEHTAIKAQATRGSTLNFLNITLKEAGGSTITTIPTVLEIEIPFTMGNKRSITVYRYHGGAADTFTALDARPATVEEWADKTVYADKTSNKLYVYTGKFSAYAIGYTQPSSPSSGNTSSSTVTNEDGSITTITTDKTTGAITETSKTTDGTTATTVTDKNGNVAEISATVPAAAANAAEKTETPVTIPVEVPATKRSEDAPAVRVDVPTGGATVEIPVESVTPGTVAVIVAQDGTEQVVRTSVVSETGVVVKLEEGATVKVVDMSRSFKDVHPVKHWATDAIDFVAARGIFNGTSSNTFTPNGSMTRQAMWMTLARMSGVDPANMAAAREWAMANEVSDGSNPLSTVTRQQYVTMLWRWAAAEGMNVGIDEGADILSYTDADKISDYALEAFQWACSEGIVSGYDDGSLRALTNASRAHAAAMMQRFCGNALK